MKTERMMIPHGNQRIYCELTVPHGKGPFPLVIYGHGYGYNFPLFNLKLLAKKGIATGFFDFGGGSPHSRTTGSSLNMSVMTQAEEMTAVLNELRTHPAIDSQQIFLCGNSQGGYVATITGINNQDLVQGMVLLCPAYIISTNATEYFTLAHPQSPLQFGNMQISQRYYTDIKDYDPFKAMQTFTKPVTLIHGDADTLVPLAYAQKAAQQFPNAHLMIAKGAGHMLSGYTRQIVNSIQAMILNQRK